MKKKIKVLKPEERPTEVRVFNDPKTGYYVTAIRGLAAKKSGLKVPHWMNGVDMRKFMHNMREEINLWREFQDEETLSKEAAEKLDTTDIKEGDPRFGGDVTLEVEKDLEQIND